jgi:hypothetical protein
MQNFVILAETCREIERTERQIETERERCRRDTADKCRRTDRGKETTRKVRGIWRLGEM